MLSKILQKLIHFRVGRQRRKKVRMPEPFDCIYCESCDYQDPHYWYVNIHKPSDAICQGCFNCLDVDHPEKEWINIGALIDKTLSK